MNRNIPIGNKICATKEKFLNQNILNLHLQTMRPQVKTNAPKEFDFLKNRKIKDAIKLQKQQEINRENQNLIFKLTNIMQQQTSNSISSLPIRKSTFTSYFPKKSLNKDYRKKELIKIVMENQQLLKRIQDQKSQYNVKDWDQERKFVEKQIANISEYPYKTFKPTKTLVQFWNNNSTIKREINKKLDPLVDNRNEYNKQNSIERNNQENKHFLTNTEVQQKSLFESDYQPYEPCKDEQIEKIVNSLVEQNQQEEQKVEEQNKNNLEEQNKNSKSCAGIDNDLQQEQEQQEQQEQQQEEFQEQQQEEEQNNQNFEQNESEQNLIDQIKEPEQQQNNQIEQQNLNTSQLINQEQQTIDNQNSNEDNNLKQQDVVNSIME